MGRSILEKNTFFNRNFCFQQNKTLIKNELRKSHLRSNYSSSLSNYSERMISCMAEPACMKVKSKKNSSCFTWRENIRHFTTKVTWVSHRPDINIYQEENTVILLLSHYFDIEIKWLGRPIKQNNIILILKNMGRSGPSNYKST